MRGWRGQAAVNKAAAIMAVRAHLPAVWNVYESTVRFTKHRSPRTVTKMRRECSRLFVASRRCFNQPQCLFFVHSVKTELRSGVDGGQFAGATSIRRSLVPSSLRGTSSLPSATSPRAPHCMEPPRHAQLCSPRVRRKASIGSTGNTHTHTHRAVEMVSQEGVEDM